MQVLRAVASLSTTSAAVLQQLASLLVLPHCMGSHSEAATQLGTLTGVPLPEGPAVRLAPRQCAAGKLGGFSSAASRHRPPISIIAGRTQICGSSCRVNGKVGGSAQQPRWYSEVVPSWQWQYRQQPLPLPPAAPLLSRRPFTVVLDLDETLVWTQRPGLSCCTTPAGCERPDAQCVLGAFTVQCEVRLRQRNAPQQLFTPARDRSSLFHRAEYTTNNTGAFACTMPAEGSFIIVIRSALWCSALGV